MKIFHVVLWGHPETLHIQAERFEEETNHRTGGKQMVFYIGIRVVGRISNKIGGWWEEPADGSPVIARGKQ